MRRLLIDTNIYTCALRGHDEVVEILRRAELIGFSVISIGELLTGFKLGKWEAKNRNELEEFLDSPRVTIYGIDETTSEFYSEIVWNLRKIGRPIPTNDIWIAATAFQHGLKLLSKDEHFKYIAGLPLV